ncbi:B12-binding domain-containing protein [Oceanicoccus sp. KOV_DT_Chl]|uniref:cobalamin B12-binding domain-containing protein n=1 Tax=Oceanicoccus sp. KOV_DT_Chl TaxID=1904639 RepID=UPI000C7B9871|nr:cobalamin-dependent protein [Oceanicoccus sp. KOV_DT_Chl]
MKAYPDIASVLENKATAIAKDAYHDMTINKPILTAAFDETIWITYFSQKILELATSMLAGDPGIIKTQVAWSIKAMKARDLHVEDLKSSYDSLKHCLEKSLSSDQFEPVMSYIDLAINSFDNPAKEDDASVLDPGNPFHVIAQRYLQAVVVGNIHQGMDIVIDSIDNGLTVPDIFLYALLPAQREVGRLWQLNKLSVAEEHLVTTTTQRLMSVLAAKQSREAFNGKTVIAATIEGNVHEVGIRAIAYLFEFAGWKMIYLGSDIPAADLPITVNCFNADVILLSISLSSQLKSMRNAIKQVRAKSESPVKIIIGGSGFIGNENLWQSMGADGYANDATGALALAEELVK